MRKVFLSSTGRDLAAYREAAADAIAGLDGYHCVRMEQFGARDWEADDFCRAKVAECEILLCIVGLLHGSRPAESESSFTEREYDAAVAADRSRLIFVCPEDFPVPGNLIENDDARRRQAAFRQRVATERIRDSFCSPDELARKVVQAIRNWEREHESAAPPPVAPAAYMPSPGLPQGYVEALRRELQFVSLITPPTTEVVRHPQVESVYVPVRVDTVTSETAGDRRERLRTAIREKQRGGEQGELLAAQPHRTTFKAAFDGWNPAEHGPMVILGGPGAGKTTLLKHMGLLALRPSGAAEPADTDLSLPAGLFPVFVRLARLGELKGSIAKVIAECPPQVDQQMDARFFQSAFVNGSCLVLLDGLDEAANATRTAELSRWIERFHHNFPNSRIIVTSRFAAYRADAVLQIPHRRVDLVPLGDDEVRYFLHKWYPWLESDPAQAARLADNLADVMLSPERSDLRSLAGTPLLLLIMALIHRSGKGLPERRVDMYSLSIDALLEHWNRQNNRQYIPAQQGRAILGPLAFWMHTKRRGTSAQLDDIVPVIARELERTPYLHERDPVRFLEMVRDRSGLLVGQSESDYAFYHPTFQEYLTADYIRSDPHSVWRSPRRRR